MSCPFYSRGELLINVVHFFAAMMYVIFVPSRRRDHEQKEDDFPADLIDTDEAIALVIDGILLGTPSLRKLTKRVLQAQRKLRKAVDDDGWKKYLKLEEIVNERGSAEAELLVRWALGHASRARG